MSRPVESLGIIGAGNITTELVSILARSLAEPLRELSLLVKPGRRQDAEQAFAHCIGNTATALRVCEDASEFTALGQDLAIEAAGHSAVADFVPDLLANGTETVIASTGALSDSDLHQRLEQAALSGGTRLVLPAGAVGGMDILAGLKEADLHRVTYTSRKPPIAWAGTHAESIVDLQALESEAVLFKGSAREAAALYPKNANVAATIALAGCGFDQTQVVLIADPSVSANIHALDVESDAASLSVRIEGHPSPANPRTSLTTVYSLAREVTRRTAPIVS